MAISQKQLQANRQNSLKARQKSSGPRNTSLTRFNAVKHGMTSLQPTMLPGENEEEFWKLYQSISDTFLPQNIAEQRLAEQITLCFWRLRRGMAAEQGIVRKFTDLEGIRWDRLLENGYLRNIGKYERRIMNRLKKLINEFVSKNSA